MNNWVLLGISMLMCLIGGISRKIFADKYRGSNFLQQFFVCTSSVISAIVLMIIGGAVSASWFTIVLGLAFGIITALNSVFCLKAIEVGPLSYTSVISSLSTIIPTLSGTIFWGETINAVQIAGIVLMLGCMVLSVGKEKGSQKINVKWIVYSALVFITVGLIGVMQKWHQNTQYKDELTGFLVIAFAVAFVFSLIGTLKYRKEGTTFYTPKDGKQSVKNWTLLIILIVIAGVTVALNNKFNLYLSGVIPSAVFYPVVNGGGLVLTTVCAVIFFKERLTVKQWIGMALGLIAVILLCNPFG